MFQELFEEYKKEYFKNAGRQISGEARVELESFVVWLESRRLTRDAPDRKGQGVDLAIEEASKNMLYELTRYAWRNLSPMYEDEAIQIIQRYLSVFAKTPLPPSGG